MTFFTSAFPDTPLLLPVPRSTPRPFWTVIVPIYERTQYLGQCLGSILDQAPPAEEMEILVQDDCSSTDLRHVAEALGRGRICFSRTSSRRGLYGNINEALVKARGQWIHVLHEDDLVLPGFYQVMKQAVVSQPAQIAMAFCHYTNLHEHDGTTWSPQPFRQGPGILQNWVYNLAVANPLNVPAVIHRREVFEHVGVFREDLPYTGDWEFYIRSACRFAWWYQPENLARFRVHPASATSALSRSGLTASNTRRTLEIAARYLPVEVRNSSLPQARRLHGQQFLAQAIAALNAGDAGLANTLLKECFLLGGEVPSSELFQRALGHPLAQALREEIARLPRR